MKHRIPTFSGLWLDYMNPTPDQITLVDISVGLSKQCRWNGQCDKFFSVAEHTINGVIALNDLKATPEEVLHFALHDAHGAYMGDIISPLKSIPGIHRTIKRIEHDIDVAIFEKFELPYKERKIVKQVDLALLAWEWEVTRNMPLNELPEHELVSKVPKRITRAVNHSVPCYLDPVDARVSYSQCLIHAFNIYRKWKLTST